MPTRAAGFCAIYKNILYVKLCASNKSQPVITVGTFLHRLEEMNNSVMIIFLFRSLEHKSFFPNNPSTQRCMIFFSAWFKKKKKKDVPLSPVKVGH